MNRDTYDHVRSGGSAYFEQNRGLTAVWGKEAVKFLDGMMTGDMKTLDDGNAMLAAFPNAQGRLLALVRVMRQGDRFLIETEESTREKLFQNLFRFTYAGDFFVEDLSSQYRYADIFGRYDTAGNSITLNVSPLPAGSFIPAGLARRGGNAIELDAETYETLRIESSVPIYGIDMDESTVVPELGLDGLISYNKGCYIGQEIIARIYFRGHIAKRLSGLLLSGNVDAGTELTTAEGKAAGRITSVTFSPKLGKAIALGYVRYDFLASGTELKAADASAVVTELPFVRLPAF